MKSCPTCRREFQDADEFCPHDGARLVVVLETRENVLRLPTAGLLSGDKVLVVERGRLAEHPVEVGLRNWDAAEIRSGLAEGDEVVTTLDRADVKPGARVTIERTSGS